MNEQIAELKAQCIVREQRGTTAFNSYMVDRFDTEKFAQLIVQACAKRSEELGQPELGTGLMKHFGVEE